LGTIHNISGQPLSLNPDPDAGAVVVQPGASQEVADDKVEAYTAAGKSPLWSATPPAEGSVAAAAAKAAQAEEEARKAEADLAAVGASGEQSSGSPQTGPAQPAEKE